MLNRNFYLLALLAPMLSLRMLFAQVLDPPRLPAGAAAVDVAPGSGLRIKYHFVGVGKQVYACENGQWAKSSTPDATLYDMNSNLNLKVRHGAGPSWTTVDGKSTMRASGSTAIHFAAPDGVSIDWLKLDVDKASRTGEFGDVDLVQRLYTGAGKAPASGCAAQQIYEAPYTAHYYFWKRG